MEKDVRSEIPSLALWVQKGPKDRREAQLHTPSQLVQEVSKLPKHFTAGIQHQQEVEPQSEDQSPHLDIGETSDVVFSPGVHSYIHQSKEGCCPE